MRRHLLNQNCFTLTPTMSLAPGIALESLGSQIGVRLSPHTTKEKKGIAVSNRRTLRPSGHEILKGKIMPNGKLHNVHGREELPRSILLAVPEAYEIACVSGFGVVARLVFHDSRVALRVGEDHVRQGRRSARMLLELRWGDDRQPILETPRTATVQVLSRNQHEFFLGATFDPEGPTNQRPAPWVVNGSRYRDITRQLNLAEFKLHQREVRRLRF